MSHKFGAVKVRTINDQVTLGVSGRARYSNLVFRTPLPPIDPRDLTEGFDGFAWLCDEAVPAWMNSVLVEKKRMADEEEEAPDGFILIALNGKIYTVGFDFAVVPIDGEIAIGSGQDFALAAMHLGKTPKQAVEVAAELDMYTGGKITEITV